jgi:septin family protein
MDNIICPHCGKDVEISEAIVHQLSQKVREEERQVLKAQFEKQKIEEDAKKEKELREEFEKETKEKSQQLEESKKEKLELLEKPRNKTKG